MGILQCGAMNKLIFWVKNVEVVNIKKKTPKKAQPKRNK